MGNIVFISHSPFLSGAERVLFNVASALNSEQKIKVVLPGPGPLEQLLKKAKIKYVIAPYILPNIFAEPGGSLHDRIVQTISLFNSLQAEKVVVNTSILDVPIYAANYLEIPLIVHVHGIFPRKNFPQINWKRFRVKEAEILGMASKILVPSNWTKRFLNYLYLGIERKVTVIPNGTILPDQTIKNKDKNKVFNIVQLSTFEKNKNNLMFLELAKELIKYKEKITFSLFGDGKPEYTERLRNYIDIHQLNEFVQIFTKRENIDEIYNNADMVVVSSHIESFCNVVVEAMSYGLPVISTKCGGPNEILSFKPELLVDDVQQMKEKVIWLIENPIKRTAIGKELRNKFKEKYHIEKVKWDYLMEIESCKYNPENRLLARNKLTNIILNVLRIEESNPDETLNHKKQSVTSLSYKDIHCYRVLFGKRRYKIKPEKDGWCGIDICFGTNKCKTLEGKVTLRIFCNKMEPILRIVEVPLNTIIDSGWTRFSFKKIKHSSQRTFIIDLEFKTNNQIGIYEKKKDFSKISSFIYGITNDHKNIYTNLIYELE